MILSTRKKVIGAVEEMQVLETGMAFMARIDTGAKTSSLHALNLSVQGERKDGHDNIGRMIHFTTLSELGKQKSLCLKIVNLSKVTNAQGTEYRYTVMMNLRWKNCQKRVEVNLKDRSHMQYKLLIGRNWLRGSFLVDVEKGDERK